MQSLVQVVLPLGQVALPLGQVVIYTLNHSDNRIQHTIVISFIKSTNFASDVVTMKVQCCYQRFERASSVLEGVF